MNKNYYKQLVRGYFEASLSPKEERRLKAFLSSTDDPDFEEVKAVAGYFSAGKAYNAVNRSGRQAQMRAFAIAASLTAIVFASVLTLSLVNKNRAKDIASMESTLTSFFSSGENVENTLSGLFDK